MVSYRNLLASSSVFRILLLLFTWLIAADSLRAQTTTVQAYSGRPFGAARVSLSIPASAGAVERDQIYLADPTGRVFYPAIGASPFGKNLGNLLANRPVLSSLARELPSQVTIHFLFRGDTPFRLTVYAPTRYDVVITPRPPLHADQAHLRDWWREYSLAAREQMQQGDYPPIVETYLLNTLDRRLGLDDPAWRTEPRSSTRLQETLDLVLGVEDLRRDVMIETLRESHPAEQASLPVPDDIWWPETPAPTAPEAVDIEPLAMRIPEECFYLRFGNISDFIWLHYLTEEHGGALSRLIALRGYDTQATQRVERRLAVRYSLLLDLVGEHVVDDLAVFGRDTYLREGPALGVVIKAKNGFLVSTAINNERRNALEREKANGATSDTIEIAGRKVSLISTPDQRLRSFFTREGDYYLLTTSRALVERFFAVSDGAGSLGASPDFHYARSLLPTSRKDAIFAYFSPAFFRQLVSPQYQIELRRRLKAVTDLELVEVARLSAAAEGQPHATVEELVQGGFLPSGFRHRADGSRVVIEEDRVYDSLRGARGNFLPIPDTPMTGVTPSEVQQYAAAAEMWTYQWKQMDPLAIGIQRAPRDDADVERISIDGYVSPFLEEKYGSIVSMLGPPLTQTLAPIENCLISAELSLQGGSASQGVPPHLMFLGVHDEPRVSLQGWPGVIKSVAFLRSIPGYLGATPKPGFVDLLPLGLSPPPDRQGYSQLPLGVWRRQLGDTSVLSFDPQLLSRVTPLIKTGDGAHPAQARLHVEDLVNAKHTSWIRDFFRERAAKATQGNLRLLEALTLQLHVPPSEALTRCQQVLDSQLVCPLGGEYELTQDPAEPPRWSTTGLRTPPTDYRAPLVSWLRGAEARLAKVDGQLTLHAEVDLQRKPAAPKLKLKLPNLPFFGGPTNAAPSKENSEPPK